MASSVGCTKGTVNIYNYPDEPTKTVVSSLFHARTDMHMQCLQKQVGATDFARAVISAIASTQLQFKQEEMRHLLNCPCK